MSRLRALQLAAIIGVAMGAAMPYQQAEAARWDVEPDPAKRDTAQRHHDQERDRAAQRKRARRASRLTDLVAKGAIEEVLPEGLRRDREGALLYTCPRCERDDAQWCGLPSEFNVADRMPCGGSQWCLP